MIVQIHNGARREEERVRRRGEGGYSEGTGSIQWGYSESTVRYSEGTLGHSEGSVGVQWDYSESTVRYSEGTLGHSEGSVGVQWDSEGGGEGEEERIQ